MEENNKAPDLFKMCEELINTAYNLIKKNIESSDGLESNVDRVARSMVSVRGCHINEHLRTALGVNDRVIARAWQRVMDEAIELDKNSSTTINHKEHQFSPSFVATESILSISTSNPGVAGDINPFAQIDEDGCFDESKMPSDTDAVSSNSSVDFHTERINRPSVLTEIVRNATKEADQPKNPAGIKRCYVTDITGSDRKEFEEEPGDDGVSRRSCSTNYKVATLTVVMEDGTEQDYKMPALLLLIARYGLGDILSMLGKDGHFEIRESKPKVLGDYRSCIKVNDNVFIVCHSMMNGCEHIAALRDIFAVHKFPKSKAHTLYDSEEYETILGEIVHPSSTTYDEAWWYGRNTILAMDKKPFERILRDLTMHLPAIRW